MPANINSMYKMMYCTTTYSLYWIIASTYVVLTSDKPITHLMESGLSVRDDPNPIIPAQIYSISCFQGKQCNVSANFRWMALQRIRCWLHKSQWTFCPKCRVKHRASCLIENNMIVTSLVSTVLSISSYYNALVDSLECSILHIFGRSREFNKIMTLSTLILT